MSPQTPLAGYRQVQTVKLEPVVLTDLFPDEQYDAICALTSSPMHSTLKAYCPNAVVFKSDGKLDPIGAKCWILRLAQQICCKAILYTESMVCSKAPSPDGSPGFLSRVFMQEARWTLEPITALERPLPDLEFQGTLDPAPSCGGSPPSSNAGRHSYQFIGIARPANDETLVKSLCEPSDSDHRSGTSVLVSVTRTGTSNDAEKITAH